jgi:hypothetical protein
MERIYVGDYWGTFVYFNGKDEHNGNDHLLECLVDNFFYISTQDQDPYIYVIDEYDVWFMLFFFVLKPFTFSIF